MREEGAVSKKHYRVQRGEPGCHEITRIVNGEPVIENLPVALASPSLSSLPALTIEDSRGLLLSRDKTANLRFTLITTLSKEAAKECGPKVKIIDRLLALYNGGLLLPGVLKELGPISQRTFYRFLEAFKDKAIEGLAPQYGRSGRKPFAQITTVEKQFLRQFLLNQNHPKIADAIRRCKYHLGEHSPSSPATLRRYVNEFRSEFHDVWTLDREGQKAWNDKDAPYQDRAWWTLEVGEILVADGHKLNFQVINPHTGKPSRAVLIMFWDWFSSYPAGWEVMLTENVQCVATALRNSILTLGKIPQCVYLDNGKAFKAKCFNKKIVLEETELPGIFERLGTDVIFTMKYNAQAKPLERIFGVLEWLERQMRSFVGNSINDKPANLRPNEDRAKKLRGDSIPKLDQVNDMIRQWRDFYAVQPLRGRKNQTARELFEPGRGPGVDLKALCFLMLKTEVKGIRRKRLTFDGFDWTGDCLYGIKSRVIVRYSLSDRNQIFVFNLKDKFLGIVEPVDFTAPRDHEAGRRIIAERRRWLRQTKALSNMAKTASPELIDLISRKNPELLEYIETQEAKKPENKRISPFADNPESEMPIKEETDKVDMAADHGSSPLSCPRFKNSYEMYEWFFTNDLEKYKIVDLGWIDWFEDGYSYKGLYENESGQSYLKYLRSNHPIKSEHNGNDPSNWKDYSLGHDPAIERRWKHIKNTIIVDPISGLSRPAEEPQFQNERTGYEFYRGIEKRFPGTLTGADWEEIKKYEATREWDLCFFEREIDRLRRTVVTNLIEDDFDRTPSSHFEVKDEG
jgi:putative transposase